MPAAYAHYRFGQAVLDCLPQSEQACIQAHRQLFDIGVHGPDILFYYRPVSSNPVSRLGNHIHTLPGTFWFPQMWEVVRQHPESGAHRAFLYGFLCHYALDSACHGYINQVGRESAFSHSQLETELDRYFLIADGKNPMRFKPTGHLHPSEENATVIADFFPQLSAREVRESLRTMVVIENLWVASNPCKRAMVLAAVKAVGKYDYATGLMRPYNAPAGCVGLLAPIVGMYERAINRAARDLQCFADLTQELLLPAHFQLPFDPQTAEEAPA